MPQEVFVVEAPVECCSLLFYHHDKHEGSSTTSSSGSTTTTSSCCCSEALLCVFTLYRGRSSIRYATTSDPVTQAPSTDTGKQKCSM